MTEAEKQQIIDRITDEADRIGADPDDADGRIRQLTGLNFCLWLCVCIELANRRAVAAGYKSEVDRAYQAAQARIAAL